MDLPSADAVMDVARSFDERIGRAAAEKYAGLPGDMLENLPENNHRLTDFVKAYRSGSFAPDRIEPSLYRALDLKFQLYLVHDAIGLLNTQYHAPLDTDPELEDSPRLQLRRVSLQQDLIGKVRILWERTMNMVYFLETGEDLDRTTKRSKTARFLRWTEDNPRWAWLVPIAEEVRRLDDNLRTPEFHKHSVLRKALLSETEIDEKQILNVLNLFISCVWDNTIEILWSGTSARTVSISDGCIVTVQKPTGRAVGPTLLSTFTNRSTLT